MKLILALVALLTLAPASASSQAENDAAGLYIAVGDSITAGIGSSLPRTRSYPAILQGFMAGYLDAPVVLENLAVPGETAESLTGGEQLVALDEAVERAGRSGLPILAVTVTLGGNELLAVRDSGNDERQQALAAFESSLPAALEAIRAAVGADVPIVISTIYDPTGSPPEVELTEAWWISRFNEVVHSAAGQVGAIVADAASESDEWSGTLSRYPSDVHPTNAGHRVLAGSFWTALALDEDAPEIEVLSEFESNRTTPTLRFSVSEAIDEDRLQVTVEDGFAYPPVRVGDGEYVALLETDEGSASALTVRIVAIDLAGNVGEASHTISITLTRPAR
jgi:lysophospholipase L1-like esterase